MALSLIANAYAELKKVLDLSVEVDTVRAQNPETVRAVRNLIDMVANAPKGELKSVVDEIQSWFNMTDREWNNLTNDLHADTVAALDSHGRHLKQTTIFSLLDAEKLKSYKEYKEKLEAKAKADKAMSESNGTLNPKTESHVTGQIVLFPEASTGEGAKENPSTEPVEKTESLADLVAKEVKAKEKGSAYDKTVSKAKAKDDSDLPAKSKVAQIGGKAAQA